MLAECESVKLIIIGLQWHQGKTYGESYRADGNNPIAKKRSCTDVLCILLFFAFLGGWGVVAYFGFIDGDINKVIYPTNSKGEVCGRGDMQDRELLMIYDLTQCLNAAAMLTGCPTQQVRLVRALELYINSTAGLCLQMS